MEQNKLMRLAQLIDELVNEDGRPWKDKRADFLAVCNGDEETAVKEFAAWFE
jgi:uncharacterized protein YifE (UPF0438 family)